MIQLAGYVLVFLGAGLNLVGSLTLLYPDYKALRTYMGKLDQVVHVAEGKERLITDGELGPEEPGFEELVRLINGHVDEFSQKEREFPDKLCTGTYKMVSFTGPQVSLELREFDSMLAFDREDLGEVPIVRQDEIDESVNRAAVITADILLKHKIWRWKEEGDVPHYRVEYRILDNDEVIELLVVCTVQELERWVDESFRRASMKTGVRRLVFGFLLQLAGLTVMIVSILGSAAEISLAFAHLLISSVV